MSNSIYDYPNLTDEQLNELAGSYKNVLTYVGETDNNTSWNYQQLQEHPEFINRLENILEDKLQTKISLTVKTRAYTQEEREIRAKAKMTPYELDLQNEPSLSRLKDLFTAELIFSRKLANVSPVQTEDIEEIES